MGDVNVSLGASTLESYCPETKTWSKKIPLPESNGGSSVNQSNRFSIASCQFAMHYMFQNRERANHFFRQLSSKLLPGGIFIATTVDSRVVADCAIRKDSDMNPSLKSDRHGNDSVYSKDIEVHASVSSQGDDEDQKKPLMMRLEFDEKNWCRLLHENPEDNDPFGIRYMFMLVDDPEKGNAVNAPEWLVPMGEPLASLAAAHGLQLDICQNFQDYVHNTMKNDASKR